MSCCYELLYVAEEVEVVVEARFRVRFHPPSLLKDSMNIDHIHHTMWPLICALCNYDKAFFTFVTICTGKVKPRARFSVIFCPSPAQGLYEYRSHISQCAETTRRFTCSTEGKTFVSPFLKCHLSKSLDSTSPLHRCP